MPGFFDPVTATKTIVSDGYGLFHKTIPALMRDGTFFGDASATFDPAVAYFNQTGETLPVTAKFLMYQLVARGPLLVPVGFKAVEVSYGSPAFPHFGFGLACTNEAHQFGQFILPIGLTQESFIFVGGAADGDRTLKLVGFYEG